MQTSEQNFFKAILPPTGTYFLAIAVPGQKLRQIPIDDFDQLLATTALLADKNCNLYFATGSFDGHRRLKSSVAQKKCYYLDVDTGNGKPYATPRDAMAEYLERMVDDELPEASYVVASGNGLHFYWELEQPIGHNEWKVGADNLKRMCIERGFHADHAITGDPARIMRVPGSKNVKDPDDPKAVRILGTWTTVDPHPTSLFQPVKLALSAEFLGAVGENDLTNMPASHIPTKSEGVFRKCAVLQRSILSGGKDDSEPLWSALLNVLYFVDDGAKYYHAISKGHPGYSPAETDDKWRSKGTSEAPTTCEHIATLDNCAELCTQCQHRNSQKTPVQLGRFEETPDIIAKDTSCDAEDVDLPPDYSVGPTGLRRMKGHDADGKPEFEQTLPANFSHKLVNMYRCADYNHGHLYKLLVEHHGKVVEIPFLDEIHDQKNWDKLLGERGVVINGPFNNRFRSFNVAWLQDLQKSSARMSQRHFGWSEDHEAFCVGDMVYTKQGAQKNHMVDNVMRDKYGEVGTFEDWRAKTNLVINDRPQSAVIVAASLGAPLIGMTQDPGCVLSCHGESGTGKTTVMKIAQALWGHPVKGMMSLDDTTNSMLNSLGIMRNLPAFWDEVRSAKEDDRMMQIVFRLTAGRERTRLTTNITQREVNEWQTILVTSSNISALGTIAAQTKDSDAGVMRVFEITVPEITNSIGDLKVTQCYGAAGRLYGKYLVDHYDEVNEAIRKTEEALKLSLGATDPERFRVCLLSSLLVGAQLGKKVLGLDFDMKSLTEYLKQEFSTLRVVSQAHRDNYAMPTLIVQYINATTQNRIVTDTIKGRGKKPVQMLSFPAHNNPIHVQIAEDGGCLLAKREFDEWVEQHVGIKGHKVKEEMERLPSVQVTQRHIAAGTSKSTARAYVYRLDMASSNWGGAFDSLMNPPAPANNVTPIS